MSGERFYVVELAGHDGIGIGAGKPSHTCSVLDRFYCHREVARFTEPRGNILGERHPRKKAGLIEWVREQAAAEAARLNTEHEAA